MENLKTYNQYIDKDVNEGLYNILNKDIDIGNDSNSYIDGGCLFSVASLFLAFISIVIWTARTAMVGEGRTITFWIAILFDLPLVIWLGKEGAARLYDIIRSKLLLKKAVQKNEDIRKIIRYYPDMEAKMAKVNKELDEALKKSDKRAISECIHYIYEISKEIAKREKVAPIVRDWSEEDEEKATRLNLSKINELLRTEGISDNLKKALTEIKKVVMHYEQSDEYPFNYFTVDILSKEDADKLKEMGFGVYSSEEKKKSTILWKWK